MEKIEELPSLLDGLTELQRVLFFCSWTLGGKPLNLFDFLQKVYRVIPTHVDIPFLINSILDMNLHLDQPRKLHTMIWDDINHCDYQGPFPNNLDESFYGHLLIQHTATSAILFPSFDLYLLGKEIPTSLVPTLPVILLSGFEGCTYCGKYVVPKFGLSEVMKSLKGMLMRKNFGCMKPSDFQQPASSSSSTCTCVSIKQRIDRSPLMGLSDDFSPEKIMKRFYELRLQFEIEKKEKMLNRSVARLELLKRYQIRFTNDVNNDILGFTECGFLDVLSTSIEINRPVPKNDLIVDMIAFSNCLTNDFGMSLLIAKIIKLEAFRSFYNTADDHVHTNLKKTPQDSWMSSLLTLDMYLKLDEAKTEGTRIVLDFMVDEREENEENPILTKQDFAKKFLSSRSLSDNLRWMLVDLKAVLKKYKKKPDKKHIEQFWLVFAETVIFMVDHNGKSLVFTSDFDYKEVENFASEMIGDVSEGVCEQLYEDLQIHIKLSRP